MRYEKTTNLPGVKNTIHNCYKHLCKEDEQRFKKKFREQSEDFNQVMHTLNELILGAYLSLSTFKVRYEYLDGNGNPDWCILDKESAVIGIAELVNFHRDKDSEIEIGKGHSVWSQVTKNDNRLYQRIGDKMRKYRALVEELKIPYSIAICPDSRAGIDFERILPCLYHIESGLFRMYPHVSGVLYFEGNLEKYSFRYELNHNALRKADLLSGVFSFVKDNSLAVET